MKADIRDKLIAALESGKYRHGKSQLRLKFYDDFDMDGEGIGDPIIQHCCLGVLCELAILEGVIDDIPDVSETDFRDGLYLPEAVEDWSGMSDKTQHDLAEVNDAPGNTSYATVIEMIRKL